MVSWSDLFSLHELDGKIVTWRTWHREILQAMHPFSVYIIMKWRFPQDNQWIYCFIVVLWEDYKTKLIPYFFEQQNGIALLHN